MYDYLENSSPAESLRECLRMAYDDDTDSRLPSRMADLVERLGERHGESSAACGRK